MWLLITLAERKCVAKSASYERATLNFLLVLDNFRLNLQVRLENWPRDERALAS